jgi:hypothetical protein
MHNHAKSGHPLDSSSQCVVAVLGCAMLLCFAGCGRKPAEARSASDTTIVFKQQERVSAQLAVRVESVSAKRLGGEGQGGCHRIASFSGQRIGGDVGRMATRHQRWSLIAGERAFVGFENYARLAHDSRFWNALGTTAYFTGVSVALELALGLAIAVLLHRAFPGKGLMRAILLIPWAVPTAVSARMWEWMYNSRRLPPSARFT